MLTTAQPPERRPSPLLSNNPFRNRAASPPSSYSPSSPNFTANLASKNPFLDSSEQNAGMTTATGRISPQKPSLSGNTAELFENLALDDKPRGLAPISGGSVRRLDHAPSRPDRKGVLPQGHRPSRSREEDDRRRRAPHHRAPKTSDQLDIFADPSDSKPRSRPRRNSDTSVVDRNSKSLETEEQRRRRKQREREAKRQNGSVKPRAAPRRLDVIDKLDVTSIFGTGVFHHDGPFDACNPNRNKKGLRTAPMAAFPKDSSNMAIGGSGPLNKDIDHAQFHGQGIEAHNDYSMSAPATDVEQQAGRSRFDLDKAAFNPRLKAEPVHGDESMGLGTSTFLEGAPASRVAIQRRESENEMGMGPNGGLAGGGLGRKKSLAQRIRGISNNRPIPGGRMTSPEPSYTVGRSFSPTSPPLPTGGSVTNGGVKGTEANPFFQDYDKEYERKGAKISVADGQGERSRAVSSPKREVPGLGRTTTNDSIGGGEAPKIGGGFLNRVKSLKGGRRTRPERREVS